MDAKENADNWQCREHALDFIQRPLVMGVINVTPDSFSDGGQYDDPVRAVDHALALVDQGADLLDIGGESTRPGAQEVSEEQEVCLLYTSPSPRDLSTSRMPSSA